MRTGPLKALTAALLSSAAIVNHGAQAQSLPTGGTVASGSISIASPSSTSLAINQTSARGIVNWSTFSIGQGYQVQFNNGSGATLNRVTGNVPSSIDGLLSATGSVYLINPAGIAVGKNGIVKTGGSFVASTLDVSDANFNAGGALSFSGASGASVVNLGKIGSSQGDVVLIARDVENGGTLSAPNGTAAMASGGQVVVSDGSLGNGKISVQLPGQNGKVLNTGAIRAAEVELRANGGNVYALAGNTGGVIKATGVANKGGRIFLTAAGGSVAVTQRITAQRLVPTRTAANHKPSYAGGDIVIAGDTATVGGAVTAKGRGAAGGAITVTGNNVTLTSAARLDASGTSGGTVLVGGDRGGSADPSLKFSSRAVANAQTTTVEAGASVKADGTAGPGGNVVVWSDGATSVAGSISATGEAGGWVETSGHTLDLTGGKVAAGNGGTWLLDPADLTIDAPLAATIATALNGGANVIEQTTAAGTGGSGDITVASAITWSGGATLTLDAYHSIAVNAPITLTGGTLNLTAETGGVGINSQITVSGAGSVAIAATAQSGISTTGLTFGNGATIDYGTTDQGGTLSINKTPYALIYSLAGLQSINNKLGGSYALATNIDASGITFTQAVIAPGDASGNFPTPFSGNLDGLGHTISGLTIATSVNLFVGLVGYSTGTISNIGITGADVSGWNTVGLLAGQSDGTVQTSYAAGLLSAAPGASLNGAGGLLGYSGGTVQASYADVAISAGPASHSIGGLVGIITDGVVQGSHASGAITAGGADTGGLAGFNYGTIQASYAAGAVSAQAVTGGLVGDNEGTVQTSYASGAVTGADNTGGLVGFNTNVIQASYATGVVTGADQVGGLVGTNALSVYSSGAIQSSYATGVVSGSNSVGGLVGFHYPGATVTNSYWDTQTSGMASSDGGIGLTTAQLQYGSAAGLGSAFAGGTGGLYPYLVNFYPDGVQAISGFAYKDGGTTLLATSANAVGVVSFVADGHDLGTTATGANGYYYVVTAAGTLGNGAGVAVYTQTDAASGSVNGVSFIAPTSAAATSANIYGGYASFVTPQLTYSSAAGGYASAAAAAAGASPTVAGLINGLFPLMVGSGASFTIDRAVDQTSSMGYLAANGTLTVAQPVTLEGASKLLLGAAGGPVAVNAAVNVMGAGAVDVEAAAVSGITTTGLIFGDGASITYAAGPTGQGIAGQSLTIDRAAYTLIFDMAGIQGINNNLFGNYAIATNLNAGGTVYTAPLVTSGSPVAYGSTSFRGMLDGLGHTITDLTIAAPGLNFVGLVGQSWGGTISNIGLVGGSVSGGTGVGSLVGYSTGGTVQTSYAVGTAVSGNNWVGYAMGTGGLVGGNSGTVQASYATGSVWATGDYGGGLVGDNMSGSILNSYATGAAGGWAAGGLVGYNYSVGSQIINTYATGAVTGTYAGGLIGYNQNNVYSGSTVVINSYWNTDTSGTSIGVGASAAPATGLTTSQLQSGAASGLGSAFAGGTGGLYPYLKSFYPSGVQAVSGTAYTDAGTTPLASGNNGPGLVTVLAGGQSFGTVTTGANGYYYVATAAGALGNGTGVLAYTQANTATGAENAVGFTIAPASGAVTTVSSLNIYGGYATFTTPQTTYSAAAAGYALALTAAAGSDPTVAGLLSGNTLGARYHGIGASFSVDAPVNLASSLYVEAANGNLTVASPITLNGANTLTLQADAGAVVVNANVGITGPGSVAVMATAQPGVSTTGLVLANGAAIDYQGGNQGGSFSLNGTPYTLVYNLADLQSINNNLAGSYALATSLDLSATALGQAVIAPTGVGFEGQLDGLGHTITGLTIASMTPNAGLLGITSATATVSDIGLVDVSVTGTDRVGGLVGLNAGTVQTSFVTGSVSGNTSVGMLAGYNDVTGTVQSSRVDGVVVGSIYTGGLIGSNSGTVQTSDAGGAVNGGNHTGGLVGNNAGTISASYTTAAVSGQGDAGGLIGISNLGTVTNAYWNVETSGTSVGIGTGISFGTPVGLSTAQLQTASLPAGFDSKVWGSGAGLYPYLNYYYPAGVQAVSGVAYQDNGTTVLASGANGAGLVSVRIGSGAVETGVTGANGYYYVAVPAGTIDPTHGTAVLAYTQANAATGAKDGAALQTKALGSVSGLDVDGGWLVENADASIASLSALNTAFGAAAGATPAAGFATPNRQINIASQSFSLDQAVTVAGTLALAAAGSVSQSQSIAAGTLILAGPNGSFALTGSNQIRIVAANTGAVDLETGVALTIGNAQTADGFAVAGVATSGAATLATTADLTIAAGAKVAAASPVLTAAGYFINHEGADAVMATSGRWLVYSAAPGNDTFGSLDSHNTAVWNASLATLPPASVSATGNRYLFALAPVLTVTAQDTKTYGDDATGGLGYSGSGEQGGVAGAFLGDSIASALAGTPTLTSAGSATTANVGTYTVKVAAGSAAAINGYQLKFVDGTLTVAPRALTITANDASKVAGAPDPALTWLITAGSLVGTDTLTGALVRQPGETPGLYRIDDGTLTASANYALTYTAGSFLILSPGLDTSGSYTTALGTPSTGAVPTPPNHSDDQADYNGQVDHNAGQAHAGHCTSGLQTQQCAMLPHLDNRTIGPWVRFAAP